MHGSEAACRRTGSLGSVRLCSCRRPHLPNHRSLRQHHHRSRDPPSRRWPCPRCLRSTSLRSTSLRSRLRPCWLRRCGLHRYSPSLPCHRPLRPNRMSSRRRRRTSECRPSPKAGSDAAWGDSTSSGRFASASSSHCRGSRRRGPERGPHPSEVWLMKTRPARLTIRGRVDGMARLR